MLFIDNKKLMIQFIENPFLKLEFGMSRKLINLIASNISQTDIKVKVGLKLSKTIQVTIGLRQSDAMSRFIQHSLRKSSKRSKSRQKMCKTGTK